MSTYSPKRRGRICCGLLTSLFLIGCSSGPERPVCYPASGRVLFENRPIAEARLTFHPLQGSVVPLPVATTGEDGQFQVTTWADHDGLPTGSYAVTIIWPQLVQQGEEKTRSGRNQLPTLYADPKRTPLRCTIKDGENKLPVFAIK